MPPFLLHPEVSGQRTTSFQGKLGVTYHGFGPTQPEGRVYNLKLRNRKQLYEFQALQRATFKNPGRRVNQPGVKLQTGERLILFAARFLTITFPRQCFLHPAFFARFQVIGMPLDFLNDVLLLDFTLETAQSIFKRFALLQSNFGQV